MKFSITSKRLNFVLLALLILLGIFSFAYNQYLIDRITEKERASVQLWARAIEYMADPALEQSNRTLLQVADRLAQNPTVPGHIVQAIRHAEAVHSAQNFVVEQIILKDRYKIPTLIMDAEGNVLSSSHISAELDADFIEEFTSINPPIKIELGSGENAVTQYIYYGESAVVHYLRYFPYIQLSLLALLLGVAYLNYRSINKTEQSNIWVGMTKEAAHQLGTPLSSMYGWVELLKEEKDNRPFLQKVTNGLEKDITRLQNVAERFNKIGSEPELEVMAVTPLVNEIMDYVEQRLPRYGKNVTLKRPENNHIKALINPELFQWALENVLKNSMNAIKNPQNNAEVAVSIKQGEEEVIIDITDSGRGIEKKYHDEIFKPGYSTKKRGWGLGLSLTRRIINVYHGGKISVHQSKIDQGTTMRMAVKAPSEEQPKMTQPKEG